MHAERVDGLNPLAIIDVMKRKKKILEEKNGPVLLDTITYRFSGHSPSDLSSYRSKEEVDAWAEVDAITTFRKGLIDAKVAKDDQFESISETTGELISKVFGLSIDDEVSPRMNLHVTPDKIADLMFSNEKMEKMEDREPDVLMPKEENPRVKQISRKVRTAYENGSRYLPTEYTTYAMAYSKL